MTPFCEGESVSSPSESRQWRRDRGSEIKPSASAGACYTALRKLSPPESVAMLGIDCEVLRVMAGGRREASPVGHDLAY